jgi:4-amino-4-deoxy-L-arabinose transferase-like glycosyltransferase
MRDSSEERRWTLRDTAWVVALVLLVGGGYLYSASQWGLWEPWETEYARMGRALNEGVDESAQTLLSEIRDGEGAWADWIRNGINARVEAAASAAAEGSDGEATAGTFTWTPSWTAPTDSRGELTRKPWLLALLLKWGYGIGDGDETGLRAPMVVLGLLMIVGVYWTLRRFVSARRAGVSAFVLAALPLVLMSAVNLAGVMPAMATTTLALCAYALALCRPDARGWLLAAGALTGLSLWGGGMTGVWLVLGAVGGLGVWEAQRDEKGVGLVPAVIGVAVAGLGVLLAGLRWDADGFEAGRHAIVFWAATGLVVALLVMSARGAVGKRAGLTGLAMAVAGFALVVLPPALSFVAQYDADELVSFLVMNDYMTGRSGAHVSFDKSLRQLGFVAYPFTVLVPLALAYLAQSSNPEEADRASALSDDRGRATVAALKVLLLCWFGVGLLLLGLGATLTQNYVFLAPVPLAAGVGMMVTDVGFWRGLRKNRGAHALIGFACVAILFVLTKDLKTSQNLELGQMGPEVLFEFLVIDGQVPFPETFELERVRLFRHVCTLMLLLYFWYLLQVADELPTRIRGFVARVALWRKAAAGRRAPVRGFRAVVYGVVSALGAVAAIMPPINRAARPVRRFFGSPRLYFPALVLVLGSFAALTARAYLPEISNHLSHRGIIDTYRALAAPGEVFYWVGGARDATNYYLGADAVELPSGEENPVEQLRSIPQLRPYFCEPDERMFALLERDTLAQAYYEVRHDEEGQACAEDRDLYVVDARSSRYVLVTNQLDPAQGVENQNPIAEHVFSEDTLPENMIPMGTEYTFDDAIKILGYRIVDEYGNTLESAGSGDEIFIETFFEVLSTPRRNFEMFIHVDHRSQRLNGDHDVVGGIFPLNYWVEGEIVRDRFPLTVDRASTAGEYSVNIGFFSGDTRMRVAPPIGDNRITLGNFRITGGL